MRRVGLAVQLVGGSAVHRADKHGLVARLVPGGPAGGAAGDQAGGGLVCAGCAAPGCTAGADAAGDARAALAARYRTGAGTAVVSARASRTYRSASRRRCRDPSASSAEPVPGPGNRWPDPGSRRRPGLHTGVLGELPGEALGAHRGLSVQPAGAFGPRPQRRPCPSLTVTVLTVFSFRFPKGRRRPSGQDGAPGDGGPGVSIPPVLSVTFPAPAQANGSFSVRNRTSGRSGTSNPRGAGSGRISRPPGRWWTSPPRGSRPAPRG